MAKADGLKMKMSMSLQTIIPLGTAGWIPSASRQTTSLALFFGCRLVLLDAGAGVSRLGDPKLRKRLASVSEVIVLLSHFHLDHVIGLSFMPLFFEKLKVQIYGPGLGCSGVRTEDALRGLLRSPYFSLPIDRFPMELTIGDLAPGANEIRDELSVHVRVQKHSDPSIGMRINGDAVAFVTDTGCDDATVEFVRGARVFFHDAYYDRADYDNLVAAETGAAELKDHGFAPGVATIARDAGVNRAYLIHLNPGYSGARLAAMRKDCRKIFRETFIPDDLEPIAP